DDSLLFDPFLRELLLYNISPLGDTVCQVMSKAKGNDWRKRLRVTHAYKNNDIYLRNSSDKYIRHVIIRGNISKFEVVLTTLQDVKILHLECLAISTIKDTSLAFHDQRFLKHIDTIDLPNCEKADGMFFGCRSLTSVHHMNLRNCQ